MPNLGFYAHQSGGNDIAHFGRLQVCDHQHLPALRGGSGKKRQKEDEVMSSSNGGESKMECSGGEKRDAMCEWIWTVGMTKKCDSGDWSNKWTPLGMPIPRPSDVFNSHTFLFQDGPSSEPHGSCLYHLLCFYKLLPPIPPHAC